MAKAAGTADRRLDKDRGMCLSKTIISGLFTILAWMLASLLVAARKELRDDVELTADVWKRVVVSALLFTVPTVATIKLLQDWVESTSEICIGKVTSLLIGFMLAALMVLLIVVYRHVEVASGVKLHQSYHGTRILLFMMFSLVFFAIRRATGVG